MSVQITLLYFASLRDAAGVEQEALSTDALTLRDVYLDRARVHAFTMPIERVRVAVDGAFAAWTDSPAAGSDVAFIPPVSGG